MSLFGKPSEKPDGRQRKGEIREPAPGAGSAERAPRGGAFAAEDSKRGGKEVANIGKSISIRGDLTGNEDIVIEGKVEGKVELPNNQLTIGANGQVKAEINAKGVIVVGRVAGNIRGTDRVEIQATGVVEGDVSAPRLVVAEGAVVNGSIQMGKEAVAAAAAVARPSSEPVRKIAG